MDATIVKNNTPVQATFIEFNQAQGEKDQRIRAADGYRLKRINVAERDVARFNAVLAEYNKAPEVARRRIYIETLQEVMPGIRSKIVIDDQMHGILPLLNLDSRHGVKQ